MRQLTLTFMLKLALRDETAEHVVSFFFFFTSIEVLSLIGRK